MGEDDSYYFDVAVPFDCYIKSADDMGGASTNMLSRFGIAVRDQIEVVVARRAWGEGVGVPQGLARPEEGDLIWFALNQRLFEVRYVQRYSMQYPVGSLPTWVMQCELVEASSARFDTGVPEIDAFETDTTQDLYRFSVKDSTGNMILTAGGDHWVVDVETNADVADETVPLQQAADAIIDFNELDPFSDSRF